MKKSILSTGLIMLAGPALAHPEHGFGFGNGLTHPLLGADHLLAMLAIGLWSGFALPHKLWLGASVFLSAMVAGAALVWAGVALPQIEPLLLASVLVFGVLVLCARPEQAGWVTAASLLAIAGFAACHGQAHALEATGNVTLYLAGFLLSTTALHLAGIALARRVAASPAAGLVQRLLGGAVAASGLYLMVG